MSRSNCYWFESPTPPAPFAFAKEDIEYTQRSKEFAGWWTLAHLGYAYGQNIEAIEYERVKDNFFERTKIKPSDDFVVYSHEYDDDGPGARIYKKIETAEQFFDATYHWEWRNSSTFDNIRTISDLKEVYKEVCSYDWGGVHNILTRKEARIQEARNEREKHEEIAKGIAAKYNVKTNSIQFLRAIQKEIQTLKRDREDWNNPEAKMERYAACSFAGCRDSYWEDNDYVGGLHDRRRDELEGVLNWFAENCPLLWAKYKETKRKRKKS